MIWLNQSATSWPKPACVREAVQACLADMPASQFRSSFSAGEKNCTELCREKLGKLLGIKEKERIFFASGATEAMNAVLCGLQDENRGGILMTQTEHNCVLRTVYNKESLRSRKIRIAECLPDGTVTKKALEEALTPDTTWLIVNHCSNVTGKIQDMEMISDFAQKNGLILIADISQSAGCIPVDADRWKADACVFTGHKGLFGIQGTGGYYVRSGRNFRPLLFGGTGRNSAQLVYEEDYEYEAGTGNLPGHAALNAGVGWILEQGVDRIREDEKRKIGILTSELKKIPGILLYAPDPETQGPLVSLNFRGLTAADAAYILSGTYKIVVRAGLHCAPLIHRAMKTEKNGTVRVSISPFTTEEEIESFLRAAGEIAGACG